MTRIRCLAFLMFVSALLPFSIANAERDDVVQSGGNATSEKLSDRVADSGSIDSGSGIPQTGKKHKKGSKRKHRCGTDAYVESNLPKKPGIIALTYDDGPYGSNTERILNVLRDNHAKATFFVVGSSVSHNANLIRRMADEGHEIGNHTWSHPDLRKISDNEMRSQVGKTSQAVKDISGNAPKMFRPPYGVCSKSARSVVGMPFVLWTVDPMDWKTENAERTKRVVMDEAQNCSIVIMHDTHVSTANASEQIIPELIAKGFTLVTISELKNACPHMPQLY